jgi:hypothetical protein
MLCKLCGERSDKILWLAAELGSGVSGGSLVILAVRWLGYI